MTQTHEWFCRQIVDKSQDAIIVADRSGRIRLWNSGAEAMFGYSALEASGQSLDLIIPEKLRDRHWQGYSKTMATGTTQYDRKLLAVPAIRKDGSRISIEFTIILLRDENGELFGPAAIIRDVTVRWERDKVMAKRLAELESSTKTRSPE